MRLESTAFVLRTYPLAESDRIVALFSRAEGKLRAVAPRAAASRKRFGGALSVLSEVEFAYVEREGRDLGRLEWCRLLQATPGEGRDLDAFYASSYLAEVLEQMGREREADDRLYRLTRVCAAALAGGLDARLVARYFEVWCLRLAGLLPDLAACAACGADLSRTGARLRAGEEALCPACGRALAAAERLPSAAVSLARHMLARPPAEIPPPGAAALQALAAMAAAQFLQVNDRPFRTAVELNGSDAKARRSAPAPGGSR